MAALLKTDDRQTANSDTTPFFARSYVGTTLTTASWLAFLFVCMVLPLVGKAAVVTIHSRQNFLAFLAALLASLAFALLATFSKMERRKIDHSPLPKFSMAMCLLSLLLLVALLMGLLRI
jgi:uncharacterized membrane protein YiaA